MIVYRVALCDAVHVSGMVRRVAVPAAKFVTAAGRVRIAGDEMTAPPGPLELTDVTVNV